MTLGANMTHVDFGSCCAVTILLWWYSSAILTILGSLIIGITCKCYTPLCGFLCSVLDTLMVRCMFSIVLKFFLFRVDVLNLTSLSSRYFLDL